MFLRIIKKFNILLEKRQKFKVVILLFLMIVGGFLEMMSVSLILPFMDLVMNSGEAMEKWYISLFSSITGIFSIRKILVIMAICMAVLYIVKNVFLLIQNNIQTKFVYNNMFYTQQKLFDSYLNQPYEYYLNVDSGETLRVMGEDTSETFVMLRSLLSFVSEMVVSVALVLTLFMISPTLTIGISVLLSISVFTLLKILRPILQKAGKDSQSAYAVMNSWLLQAIQGIKEIKIMRKEKYFKENFNKSGLKRILALRKNNVLVLVPRFMIEAISMSAFFIVIAFLIYNNVPLVTLVPLLSAVAMAALRILPAANRISLEMGNMAYRESKLDKVLENLIEARDNTCKNKIATNKKAEKLLNWDKEFGFSNVTYKYPTGSSYILNGASIKIKKGESVGIVGPSGAGKTTTVDIILGLLKCEAGTVYVDEYNIFDDLEGWLSEIGYISQSIFMLDDDIRSNVAFGIDADKISDNDVWEALKKASLYDFVSNLENGIETQIGERGVRLSGGQKQRIGIARALYKNPSILIFDEATSSLDNETEKAIIESINKLHGEKTMIIIAHRMSTIEGCDRIYQVNNEKIYIKDNS